LARDLAQLRVHGEGCGGRRAAYAGFASLLASAGTLVCCALPALLVAVGAGAAVLASAVTAFPALVWLSEYQEAIFAGAAVMLLLAGVMQWRSRALPCPVDPVLAKACMRTRRVGLAVYLGSVAVFGVGALFAFVLPWAMSSSAV
jgi:hypothetical protein